MIQGFKDRFDAAGSDATAENKGVRDAGTRRNVQDGPPENAKVGHATDRVEVALADALTRAAQAGQWDVVSRLADELGARRRTSSSGVDLDSEPAGQDRTK